MSEPLGDLAGRIARQFAVDSSALVQEASVITEEAALQADNNLFTKIRFSWRPEDKAILDRIRCSAESVFEEAFGEVISVIDYFYMQLRCPEQREVNGQRVVVRDSSNRVVWKKNADGKIVEDWNQLTGQDVEHTLANLERLKLDVAPKVNELMLEALYARHVASDVYDDAWGSIMDGTQGDRTARSNQKSRVDRYHAYFRYYIFSVAKTFLDEISAFQKLLADIRFWQVRTHKG